MKCNTHLIPEEMQEPGLRLVTARRVMTWSGDSSVTVKSSRLYLNSAFNIKNCNKATAQYQNRKIVCQ